MLLPEQISKEAIKLPDKTGDLNKTIKKIQSEEEEIEYIFFNIDSKDIKVSSELNATNKNSYLGKNIIDFNTKTAWVEGVKGDGIGEWIEINYKDWITPIRVRKEKTGRKAV